MSPASASAVFSPDTAHPAVQAAVADYFAGERMEMTIAIVAFVVVAAASAWFYLASRSGFALALMLTVGVFAAIMGGGLASLLIRDRGLSAELSETLAAGQSPARLEQERERVRVVISKFRYYHYGALVLGALALAGFALSSRDWIHGIAAGLLLVVVAQVIIDRSAEARARFYLSKITPA